MSDLVEYPHRQAGTDPAESAAFADAQWHDLLVEPLDGRAWDDVAKPTDRLPARAESLVREEVWNLSRQPVGLSVTFTTEATELFVRWAFDEPVRYNARSPGQRDAGLDCYGQDDDGAWYWVGAAPPLDRPSCCLRINQTPLDGRRRRYRLYLPNTHAPAALSLGVPAGASVQLGGRDPRKPVVYYGTSIVHAAGASRAGMGHTAILQRRLDLHLVNLGFSGNARLEPELAQLLAELDPALYVIDAMANNSPESARALLGPFIRSLRAAHSDTPILVVPDRLYTDHRFQPSRERSWAAKREVFDAVLAELAAEGVAGIHRLPHLDLFGTDTEGSVDGSHPSDLGAWRMAKATTTAIASILGLREVAR
ncbi:MAG: GDSL-type esterase/lipase family protein [Planctomycetota bacterium]|jgi:hypothetical protein|nr:GDSL-type esterase/lipase family protein [Planctomycetota bacterium]